MFLEFEEFYRIIPKYLFALLYGQLRIVQYFHSQFV